MIEFEAPSSLDLALIERQLERPARGVIGVARRCALGRPQVTVNAPVRREEGRWELFPTLFWLTCPFLVRAVSRMEAGGWIARLRRRVSGEPAFRSALEVAHRGYAEARAALIPPALRASLERDHPDRLRVIETTGVGGNRNPAGIKCLHAHYADYLARGANPVGEAVHRWLAEQGVPADGGGRCDELCTPLPGRGTGGHDDES